MGDGYDFDGNGFERLGYPLADGPALMAKAGNIALLIMSRGNPDRLAATVLNFFGTAFNPKLLQFRIGCDDDDDDTLEAVRRLEGLAPVVANIGHGRPKALGERILKLAAMEPADFYCVLNDDVFVMGTNWDLTIRAGYNASAPVGQQGLVQYWDLADCVFGADYPIISRRWYEAVGGAFFTEHFPFWFDDRWLGDVYRLATLCRAFTVLPVKLCARKDMTARMRDLAFWFDYYLFLEPLRFHQVAMAMQHLKMPGVERWLDGEDIERNRIAAAVRAIHEEHRQTRPNLYARFHDPSDPDPAYVAQREAARAEMARGWGV